MWGGGVRRGEGWFTMGFPALLNVTAVLSKNQSAFNPTLQKDNHGLQERERPRRQLELGISLILARRRKCDGEEMRGERQEEETS